MPNHHDELLSDISRQILQSRYRAARLVNRELLLLYYAVGRRLSEKIAAEKWGAKVVEQLSADLQKKMPGLRGFSRRNLFNTKAFADEYAGLHPLISASVETSQIPSALIGDMPMSLFFSLGFSHHKFLIDRCKDSLERLFYMQKAVSNQWTHEMLEWQIKAGLYPKRGKLVNNFDQALPKSLKDTALQAFKDEYLLDFINVEKEDERVFEKGIVQNIREFILKMGNGFRS